MGLIDRAKADIKTIIENTSDFGVQMAFVSPANDTATVMGLHTKHRISISPEGVPINARNAHVSVSEASLTALGYPVRENGEVKLSNHRVTVKDSTGEDKTYVIKEWFPDETIGMIVCILGDYAGD